MNCSHFKIKNIYFCSKFIYNKSKPTIFADLNTKMIDFLRRQPRVTTVYCGTV